MIFYHATSKDAADAILRNGFRDGSSTYATETVHSGVWLSDQPLDCNEGAAGDTVLMVEIDCTEHELADYEWIEEGNSYREWLVPAALINAKGRAVPNAVG